MGVPGGASDNRLPLPTWGFHVLQRLPRTGVLLTLSMALAIGPAACTSAPKPSTGFAGANVLGKETGVLAKRRTFADKAKISSATSIRIAPVTFLDGATPAGVKDQDAAYVAAAAAGAFCRTVAKRFTIVEQPGPGVIDIRITITNLKATNAAAAAATAVLPIRAPIGLGGLSLEGVAVLGGATDPAAAIVWSRQAAPVIDGARISKVGDAFDFATSFGRTFAGVIVDNGPPKSAKADAPKDSPCDRYGKMRLAAAAFEFFGPPLPPAAAVKPPAPDEKRND